MKSVSCYKSFLQKDARRTLLLGIAFFTASSMPPAYATAADSYSKISTVTVESNKIALTQLFSQIEKQSEFLFFYVDTDVQNVFVKVQARNKNIDDVLNQALKGTGLTYTINNRNVNIQKVKGNTSINQQNRKIAGKVTDANGETIMGANIVEVGTTNGTVSDVNGQFSLNLKGTPIIRVTFTGYTSQDINTNGKNDIVIVMQENSKVLDEVVVVGYGTQKKVNLTGSVAVVDGKELANRPVANITQSLQGVVPGLTASVTSKGGTPGASYNIQLRGQGNLSSSDSPYVLIDGLEGSLSAVNANDIENISVLKDAAAASIYGARAAYGVILITTKRGKEGKPSITYNGNIGATTAVNLPDMVNSYEFAKYFNAGWVNADHTPEYSDAKIELLRQFCENPKGMNQWPEQSSNKFMADNSAIGVGNTNNFKLFYKDAAIKQDHNLSVTGGAGKIKYYLSGGLYKENGLIRYADIDFKRLNFSANIDSEITNWLKFNVKSKYSNEFSTSPFGGYAVSESGFFHNLARTRPTNSMYDLNGNFTELSQVPYLQSGSKNDNNNGNFSLTAGFIIEPVKNWKINFDYSYRLGNNKNEQAALPASVYMLDGSTTYMTRSELGIPINGSYYRLMAQSDYNSLNLYSNYSFKLGESNNFNVMAGAQDESYKYSNLWSYATDLLSFGNPGLNIATGDKTTGETRNGWATRGFFGRINYDYEGRYLVEVNGRYDGSSRFAKNNRWGFFPSASLGWNIAQERFMEPINKTVSNLKLRASYGQLGNQSGAGLYTFAQTMGTATQGSWFFNGTDRQMIIYAPGSYNPDVTWEKIESINFGLDYGFFNNKLSGSLDVFQRTTRDMLGPTESLAAMYGTSAPDVNNATMRNRGWEFSINYKGRINKDITYSVGGMIYDYTAKVLDYVNPTKYNPAGQWYPGRKVGEIWGYRAGGLIQSQAEADEYNKLDHTYLTSRPWMPGDVKYLDLNDDKKINIGGNKVGDMGDKVIIGNSAPRYQYSINGSINYKGWSLSMLWQGVMKRDYDPSGSVYFWGCSSKAQVTVFSQHLDYWSESNPGAYYPRPYISTVGNINSYVSKTQQTCDRYIQNAAYIRLKNVTLSYELPSQWIKKIGLQRVNVYATGDNLLTFTKLAKMFDPETVFAFNEGGKDYALTKVFSFGLSVNL
ncbi:SusC/RagA family TonB-linked outer membrane protein [Bacteroides sedimenti]